MTHPTKQQRALIRHFGLRKIKFFVIYNPATRQISGEIYRYKYEVPQPSKGSGKVIVECKGFYTGGRS